MGSRSFKILQLTEIDDCLIDEMFDIEKDAFQSGWTRQNFVDEVNSSCFIGFGCFIDDKIVGFLLVQNVSGEIYISDIAVDVSMQRMGIGSLLMKEIIRFSEDHNSDFITLEVRKSNVKAIRLYKKFNFKVVGERRDYYSNPKEDAIIMTR